MKEINFFEALLGLSDLIITEVITEKDRIILICKLKNIGCKCPKCGQHTQLIKQYKTRLVRDLDISGKEVWLRLRLGQLHCKSCNSYFNESKDWLLPYKSYTKRQKKWIFEMCSKQPFTEAGSLLNMNAKTVERIYYEMAKSKINLPARYAKVRKLGIDELAHRKGKKDFVCVLVDLERNIELDILPDRKKATLVAHFESLGKDFCNQIQVVCCDIWKTYILTAQECFPNATVVLDRFHIVKALNKVLDEFRKGLRREQKEEDAFKKLKWKLFKRPDKCSTQQLQEIEKALSLSDELRTLYNLRNEFNTMFDKAKSEQSLLEQLDIWIIKGQKTKDEELLRFIKMLQKWKNEIVSFAKHRITNAATEGLNNYIRYFKRISFGLPNFEHMRLRILMASGETT